MEKRLGRVIRVMVISHSPFRPQGLYMAAAAATLAARLRLTQLPALPRRVRAVAV